MKKGYFYFATAITLLSIVGCKKVSEQVENLPIVQIFPIETVTASGATVTARVISVGNVGIKEYGFAWSPYDGEKWFPFAASTKISMGSDLKKGYISQVIDREHYANVQYFVHFYVLTESGKMLSQSVTFVSKGAAKQAFVESKSTPPFSYILDNNEAWHHASVVQNTYLLNRPYQYNYNVSSESWSFKINEFYNPLAAVDKRFFILGNDAVNPRDYVSLLELDIETGIKKTLIPRLPEPFYAIRLSYEFNNKLYILSGDTNIFWEIDLTTLTSRRINNPPVSANFNFFSASLNFWHLFKTDKRLFVLVTEIVNSSFVNGLYEYNSLTDTWKRLSDYPGNGAWQFWHGVGNDGMLYVGGGSLAIPNTITAESHAYYDMWQYNLNTNEWQPACFIPRNGAACVSFLNQGLNYWISSLVKNRLNSDERTGLYSFNAQKLTLK